MCKNNVPGIIRPLIVFVICCAISMPSFFDSYRSMAFNTMPRDDYAPFLIRLISGRGAWPESPDGYRVLSVLPSVPLYWILPLYKFSRLHEIDAAYLRAVEALAFLDFLAVAAAATVAFEFVYEKIRGNIGEAGLTAALTIILAGFLGRTGIEPFAVLVIFVLLYVLEHPLAFSLIVLPSPFVNEKVVLFIVFLTIFRCMFARGFFVSHRWQTISSVFALGLYVGALIIIRLPGNQYQQMVSGYLPRAFDTAKTAVGSFRGFELDILPTLVVVIPCILFSLFAARSTELLARSDFLVPLGLAAVGGATTPPGDFNIGRVTAFALPLTVIACGVLVNVYNARPESREMSLRL
jgi:hypothetical protein